MTRIFLRVMWRYRDYKQSWDNHPGFSDEDTQFVPWFQMQINSRKMFWSYISCFIFWTSKRCEKLSSKWCGPCWTYIFSTKQNSLDLYIYMQCVQGGTYGHCHVIIHNYKISLCFIARRRRSYFPGTTELILFVL